MWGLKGFSEGEPFPKDVGNEGSQHPESERAAGAKDRTGKNLGGGGIFRAIIFMKLAVPTWEDSWKEGVRRMLDLHLSLQLPSPVICKQLCPNWKCGLVRAFNCLNKTP